MAVPERRWHEVMVDRMALGAVGDEELTRISDLVGVTYGDYI